MLDTTKSACIFTNHFPWEIASAGKMPSFIGSTVSISTPQQRIKTSVEKFRVFSLMEQICLSIFYIELRQALRACTRAWFLWKARGRDSKRHQYGGGSPRPLRSGRECTLTIWYNNLLLGLSITILIKHLYAAFCIYSILETAIYMRISTFATALCVYVSHR